MPDAATFGNRKHILMGRWAELMLQQRNVMDTSGDSVAIFGRENKNMHV